MTQAHGGGWPGPGRGPHSGCQCQSQFMSTPSRLAAAAATDRDGHATRAGLHSRKLAGQARIHWFTGTAGLQP
jgi:hypothetical protein